MKTFNRLVLITGLTATLLLLAMFLVGMLSISGFVMNGTAALSLFAAGIALVLLENASAIFRYAGIFCGLTGFLVLTAAAYQFIELSTSWHIGVALLSFALMSGMVPKLLVFNSQALKWIGIISATLLLIVVMSILFKSGNQLIYQLGTVLLSIFSAFSVAAAILRPNPQD